MLYDNFLRLKEKVRLNLAILEPGDVLYGYVDENVFAISYYIQNDFIINKPYNRLFISLYLGTRVMTKGALESHIFTIEVTPTLTDLDSFDNLKQVFDTLLVLTQATKEELLKLSYKYTIKIIRHDSEDEVESFFGLCAIHSDTTIFSSINRLVTNYYSKKKKSI